MTKEELLNERAFEEYGKFGEPKVTLQELRQAIQEKIAKYENERALAMVNGEVLEQDLVDVFIGQYDHILFMLNEAERVLNDPTVYILTVKTNDHDLTRICTGERPSFVNADGVADGSGYDKQDFWKWFHTVGNKYGLWWYNKNY